MGGQACILYGAAEFSRDADFAVLSSAENLSRLRSALGELRAEVIAVPPFEREYLDRGHAIHFRAHHPAAQGFRIDVMSKLRGVDEFALLWERRSTFELSGAGEVEIMSLPDLVASKKTQRDKDWVMIRRLVEASYARDGGAPNPERIDFWIRESRTPEILVACARSFREEAQEIAGARGAAAAALEGDELAIREELAEEEARERALDREYWRPLRAELEELRRARREEK
jgi:hypothetical protein